MVRMQWKIHVDASNTSNKNQTFMLEWNELEIKLWELSQSTKFCFFIAYFRMSSWWSHKTEFQFRWLFVEFLHLFFFCQALNPVFSIEMCDFLRRKKKRILYVYSKRADFIVQFQRIWNWLRARFIADNLRCCLF